MIPLFKPYIPATFDATATFERGSLAMSPICSEFEVATQRYLASPKVLSVNTFNNALFIACHILGLRPGDRVVASPMACLASTQPFAFLGIKFIWCDVDPRSGTLCVESVATALKAYDVKAVIHNHFAGYAGDIRGIMEICREYSVPVINDCIEAFGTKYHGLKQPFFDADITIYSGNPVRFLNTVDGALLVIPDDGLRNKASLLRDSGIDRLRFRDELGEISADCDISHTALSATQNSVFASLGLAQIDKVDSLISQHRENASHLTKFLDRELKTTGKDDPNYWVLGGLFSAKREFIKFMRREGIAVSSVHMRNDLYSVFGDAISFSLTGVDEFSENFVAIPCGWWLSTKDILQIENGLKKWFFKEVRNV
tara:strand:+ start:8649 stop:9761 length:1113 start_codon:yes stop_codon:yes gene_type:complete